MFRTIAAAGFLSLLGCQRDKVAVYDAPKEAPAAPAMSMGGELPHDHPPIDGVPAGAAAGDMGAMELPPGHPPIDGSMAMGGGDAGGPSSRGVTYTAPKGWMEKPPSQMRVASFSATGKNGQAVDISVVSLAGEAGGDLSNVNRWRGQIGLPPVSEEVLRKETRRITPAGRPMLMADMVSADFPIENKFKRRLVAVIHSHGGQSWFFKMIGEDSAVAENVPALLGFLESLKFTDK